MTKGRYSSKGFTIVELLIVVVVIAILAAISIVAYNGIANRAKESAVLSSVSQGVKKIMAYATQNADQYPTDATTAGLVNDGTTTYQVSSVNGASKTYCVTVSAHNLTYFQTSVMSKPLKGTCFGLVAWWPFNGNAQDVTGNNIHGTVNGATLVAGQNGVANSAYALGQTAQNISVGSPAQFSSLPSAFTYSVWVARTGTATNQWPVVMGAADTHRDFAIRTSGYGANVYFEWGTSPFDGSTWLGTGSQLLSVLNEWHHVAVTYDGTNLVMYWDGVQRYNPSASLRPVMGSFLFTSATNGWMGNVDDARVYNRPLSAAEVRAIFDGGAY